MSIQTEVNRIEQNIADTYVVLSTLGADMPEVQNSENLVNTAGSAKVVLYSEQNLTDIEKQQARSNINAIGEIDIANLYVWKKYGKNPYVAETIMSDISIGVAAVGYTCTIEYADTIEISDGIISFINIQSIVVEDFDKELLKVLNGKYVKTTSDSYCYKVDDSASFSRYSSSIYTWGIKASLATKIETSTEPIGAQGYVSSSLESAYPKPEGVKGENWYQYRGQIGDFVGAVSSEV